MVPIHVEDLIASFHKLVPPLDETIGVALVHHVQEAGLRRCVDDLDRLELAGMPLLLFHGHAPLPAARDKLMGQLLCFRLEPPLNGFH